VGQIQTTQHVRVGGSFFRKQPSRLFAMGTHSQYPDTWLINGLIQMAEVGQLSLDL
jgi:hypothetical protein